MTAMGEGDWQPLGPQGYDNGVQSFPGNAPRSASSTAENRDTLKDATEKDDKDNKDNNSLNKTGKPLEIVPGCSPAPCAYHYGYDSKLKTNLTAIVRADGTVELRAGNIPWRDNNPGDIRDFGHLERQMKL